MLSRFFARFFSPVPIVVVVCTANICRSPVAAAILRQELEQRGARRLCRVASAGVRVAGVGQLPDPRMIKLAKSAGVSLRGERATPLSRKLVEKASLIVAMEQRHLDSVETLLGDSGARPQLRLFGSWLGEDATGNGEIADPYFSNTLAMEHAFDQIQRASQALADALISGELVLPRP